MRKIISFLLIICLFSMSCICAEEISDEPPRADITLRWGYVQASIGGYAIYMWDGYAYREVDRVEQEVLEWSSDEARIYPDEALLESLEPNSMTQSLFTAKGKGKRLRNTPKSLYNVMQESTETKRLKSLYSTSEMKYEDTYFFKIATINEHEEYVFSEVIATQTPNVNEVYNMAPTVSVIINNDEDKTTERKVELKIVISDDISGKNKLKIRVANDSKENLEEKDWKELLDYSGVSYDTKTKENTLIIKDWELSEGLGQKRVFVQAMDESEKYSVASDSIILEEIKLEQIDIELSSGEAHATKLDIVFLEIEDKESIEDLETYTCLYKINKDEDWRNGEITQEGKIKISFKDSDKNKLKISVKLVSEDGKKEAIDDEVIIWRL